MKTIPNTINPRPIPFATVDIAYSKLVSSSSTLDISLKIIAPRIMNIIPIRNRIILTASLIRFSLKKAKQDLIIKVFRWVFSVRLLRDLASLFFPEKTHQVKNEIKE